MAVRCIRAGNRWLYAAYRERCRRQLTVRSSSPSDAIEYAVTVAVTFTTLAKQTIWSVAVGH